MITTEEKETIKLEIYEKIISIAMYIFIFILWSFLMFMTGRILS